MPGVYLTITANSALDRVFFIDRFIPGATMRSTKVLDCVGGKGFDCSVVFRALGQRTVALGFIAGTAGKSLARILDRYGIEQDLVWVDGETRIAHVIAEAAENRHSHITTPGYVVRATDLETLLEHFRRQLSEASWVVGAGSLSPGIPEDFYATIVRTAASQQLPTLIDCSGEAALQAMPAGPSILKMNRSEFGQTFCMKVEPLEALARSAFQVAHKERLQSLVITCGEQGVLAITPEGSYLATSPSQVEVNAAGAGDAVSASLAWRLSVGDSWREALRWAAATSAAVVLTEGTADCDRAEIDRIYPSVSIQEYKFDLERPL